MIHAGIIGGSGYMGGELLRKLLEHPNVEVDWVTSRKNSQVDNDHRNLCQVDINYIQLKDITPCDVVFIALPSGHAIELASTLLKQGTKVIDLGSDFRLKNIEDWNKLYHQQHTETDLVKKAIYGITEIHRDKIKNSNLIANPGCYASSAILGLAPLIKNKIIDRHKIVVDGLSGTAGVGATPDKAIHHPEISNNLVPYNVVDHRHTYEIEQELGQIARDDVTVHFTTTYVPITRGILTISHSFPLYKVKRDELLELYRDYYKDEFFIKIVDMQQNTNSSWNYDSYPWVSTVSGTNFCHIGLEVDENRNRIVVFSVLDSLGKGGSHAGVQNMNLMFGLDEKTGLKNYGFHPY